MEHVATLAVELDVHLRQAVFGITPLGCMHDPVPGQDDATVELHRAPLVDPVVDLRGPVVGRRLQAELQVGELVDLALRVRGVLDARQVDDDTRAAEFLHQGLGDAHLVDPVAQPGQVLLDGIGLDLVDLGLLHRDLEAGPAVHVGLGEQVVGLAELPPR